MADTPVTLNEAQVLTLGALRAAHVRIVASEGWTAFVPDPRSAAALVRRGLAESKKSRVPRVVPSRLFRITPAGIAEYDRRASEDYGFTCRICNGEITFKVVPGDHETPDALRYAAGWSLTPGEYPYDGNAYYYCPTCHTRQDGDA